VTDGDVEFIEVLVSMVVCTGGISAILLGDEHRQARRHRLPSHRSVPGSWISPHAWLRSTRDAAILGTFLFSWLYGCPAVIVYFTKSRWSREGFLYGLLWAIVLFAANAGALIAIEQLRM
jgi:hypothetical protein